LSRLDLSRFLNFSIELPVVTAGLLAVSQYALDNAREIVALLGLAILCVCVVWALSLRSPWVRRLVTWIPLLGTMLHLEALRRFMQLLALLVEHRTPMPEAVGLAGDACGDAALRDDCRHLSARIAAGESFEVAVLRLRSFPLGYRRAMALRSAQPWFASTQRALAEIYAARIRAVLMFLSIVIPILLVLATTLLFGFVVISLFLPIIQLLNDLG
jgi:type IV pilus assembly protein PilC